MGSLELEWLGTPRVFLDGRQVKLETRKSLALLAYLSIERRPVAREFLATLLWPEYDMTRAPANLRRTLTSLQTTIGKGWISADRETIGFSDDGEPRTDVSTLAEQVAHVRAHHSGDGDELCAECAGLLAAAAEGYRGEFMRGLTLRDAPEFDLWQLRVREAVAGQVEWTLDRLTRA